MRQLFKQLLTAALLSGVAISVTAFASTAHARQRHSLHANGNGVTYLAHPAGCPGRAFCGCGASVRVFGHSVRSLWPSCAWFDGRFPRSAAAPGMVAGRCGHVFVLEEHAGGNNWIVSDYNSGGHRSRRHVRSVAGMKIVNPHGGRTAALSGL